MHTRFAALMLSALLAVGVAGCSKKEQTQAPQTSPAATDQSAQQQAPASSAAGGMAQNAAPNNNTGTPAATSGPAAAVEAQKEAPPPPPPPPPLVVPAGTSLVVRLGSTIDTKTAQDGQPFTGTLARSVAVGGEVAIPSGAGVSGTVVEAKSPGKFKGEGVLSITLHSVDVHGIPTEIATSSYTQTIKGKGKRTAVMAGGGTGAGALIGGLAGGGKGALIGGLVGAGAGTAGAAFTGNKDLTIPAESAVTFRLAHSITVKRTGQKMSKTDEQPPPVQQ
jgi:hypothetical protein